MNECSIGFLAIIDPIWIFPKTQYNTRIRAVAAGIVLHKCPF
jgi:hypothetical protein